MAVRTDVFTPAFLEAFRDYRWLADQGYPARRAAEFVGDRYALSKSQRSILYRGVYSRLESMRRMEKRTPEVPSGPLHIDGFNVILCVLHYLVGRTIYIATDGYLRDDGEAAERGVDWERAEEAAGLVCGFLRGLSGTSPVFLLDSAVPAAESLAAFIARSIRGYGGASGITADVETAAPEGLALEPRRGLPRPEIGSAAEARATAPEILITRNPDSLLSSRTRGCVATSDSIVIDRSPLPVCDLPRAVLFSFFRPVIADLGAFLPLSTIQENR